MPVNLSDVAEEWRPGQPSISAFRSYRYTGSGYSVNPKCSASRYVYIGITSKELPCTKDVVAELEKIPEVVESQYTIWSIYHTDKNVRQK